jgi:signal transduction histidine kinase
MKGGLRGKIIAWSFVPTAIIFLAVALVTVYAYQRVTENLVIERDRELTHLSAQLLANDLATHADAPAGVNLKAYNGIVAFDKEGNILAADPEHYDRWRPSWLKEFSRERLQGLKDAVYSDIVYDGMQGYNYIVVVTPIRSDGGQITGGLAGLYRLGRSASNALYASLENLRIGSSKAVYLVDSRGRVIYHTHRNHIGKSFGKRTAVEMVVDGFTGAYRTKDLAGEEIVASFAPVPGTPWGLVIEENWDALTQSSQHYGQILLVLLALGVVAPTVIATVGVRRITHPISELIRAAEDIAGGRYERRIEASSADELEDLAQQFNLMAAHLQESYASLERRVANRTKELATLNTIAAEVSQSLDLRQILEDALDEVLEVLNMESGRAFRLEEASGELVSIARRGLSSSFVRRTTRLPLGDSLAGQAARTGQPAIRRAADYPPGEMRELVLREGLELLLSIPLMVHGRCVGAINVGTRTPRYIEKEEVALLAAIGHQIGVAVENARLYEQAQQLAVMKERNRLARDLHDSVTQALFGITLYSEAASRQLLSGQIDLAAGHLCEIQETAQESLQEMRLLIFELRLPVIRNEGLAAALQARLEAVEARVGLQVSFESQLRSELSPEVEEGLYRIAQEALNNTLRHAHAQNVIVRLNQNGRSIDLEVSDDGVGFDLTQARNSGGFGLRGMEERAARLGGALTVESKPDQGTRIVVEVQS